jgi:hypothetical protein
MSLVKTGVIDFGCAFMSRYSGFLAIAVIPARFCQTGLPQELPDRSSPYLEYRSMDDMESINCAACVRLSLPCGN